MLQDCGENGRDIGLLSGRDTPIIRGSVMPEKFKIKALLDDGDPDISVHYNDIYSVTDLPFVPK